MCARTDALAAILLLATCDGRACEGNPPERHVTIDHELAGLRLRLPPGAVATYDAATDRWWLVSADDRAMLERAPPMSVASPEALRHDLERAHWPRGSIVEITGRESLSDGFSATFVVSGAHETVVVRELGSRWLRCFGSLALCRSVKRAYD